MMRTMKIPSVLLAVVLGLAALFLSLGLLGGKSSVLAQEQALAGPISQPPQARPPAEFDFTVTVVFTDPAAVDITDLSGNTIGQGVHQGSISCNRDNCSKRTRLTVFGPQIGPAEYEYRFKVGKAFDPEAERVIVAGTGTILSGDKKEKFSFTAIVTNNKDGTVSVTYDASRADASFIIPSARAAFKVASRR